MAQEEVRMRECRFSAARTRKVFESAGNLVPGHEPDHQPQKTQIAAFLTEQPNREKRRGATGRDPRQPPKKEDVPPPPGFSQKRAEFCVWCDRWHLGDVGDVGGRLLVNNTDRLRVIVFFPTVAAAPHAANPPLKRLLLKAPSPNQYNSPYFPNNAEGQKWSSSSPSRGG